jgi:acyl-CoA thioesterase
MQGETNAAEQRARAAAETMWAADAASQALGMRLDEVGLGRCVMSMTVTEAMLNGHKTCHGGFMFLLADSCFAFACNSHGQNAVAFHCSVTFIKPPRLGDRLVATATERQREGRSGIYDVTVARQGGEVVAEFRGHSRTIAGEWVSGEAK